MICHSWQFTATLPGPCLCQPSAGRLCPHSLVHCRAQWNEAPDSHNIAAFSLGFATIPSSLLFQSPFHHSALAQLQPGHFSSLVWGLQLLLHQSFHQTLLSCFRSPSSSAKLPVILIAPVSTHLATSAHSSYCCNHFLPISSKTPFFWLYLSGAREYLKPGRISEGPEKKNSALPIDTTLPAVGKDSDTSHLSFKWIATY